LRKKQNQKQVSQCGRKPLLVPETGIEPVRPFPGKRRILSPLCLPISPLRQIVMHVPAVIAESGTHYSSESAQIALIKRSLLQFCMDTGHGQRHAPVFILLQALLPGSD
jgi:hypothetical protein